MPILISICLSGRNDNYGHDFKRRFVQAMNFLAWSAKRAEVLEKIEVVFTDWNSDIPLSSELELSADAAQMVRFIEVPPEIARPLNYGKTPFHTCKSLNVAFRRAEGKFIAMMPADVLWTQYPLRSLVALLEKRWPLPFDPDQSIMMVPRREIDYDCDDSHFFTSPEEIEKLLLSGACYMENAPVPNGHNAGSGMYLLSKRVMLELRGCDEGIGGYGYSDNDIALRASDRCRLYRLDGFGIYCYDFEPNAHMISEKQSRSVTYRSCLTKTGATAADWGLGNLPLKESHAKRLNEFMGKINSDISSTKSSRSLFRGRMIRVFLRESPIISAIGMALGTYILNVLPKRILVCGLSDTSCCAAIAMGDPFIDLTIIDSHEDNAMRMLNSEWPLKRRRMGLFRSHYGPIHYMISVPEDAGFTGKFDLIVAAEHLIPDEKITDFLTPKGSIFSSRPIAGLDMPEYQAHGVYLYTKIPFDPGIALIDWAPAMGNIFTPLIRRIRRPYRWAALFGRLPLREWPAALKFLRSKEQ